MKRDIRVSLPKRIHTHRHARPHVNTHPHTHTQTPTRSRTPEKPREGFRFRGDIRFGLSAASNNFKRSFLPQTPSLTASLHQSVTPPHAASSLARGEPRGAPSVCCRGAGTERSVTPVGKVAATDLASISRARLPHRNSRRFVGVNILPL